MLSQRTPRSTHAFSDEKPRVHLPRINDGRPSVDDVDTYVNPFYVPPDEEIFKLKNKEKEMKQMERNHTHSLKIWQKGIKHTSEGTLRKIKELANFEDENPEERDGKLDIVEAAKSAIKNRVHHREPLLNFLNKKRDMFLFQMSINEKKEQIKEFEEIAHLQEISLQNSKDLLEKDAETFKQHVEKNKNETRQAIKNAEDETKEKQKKIQEMKRIQEDLSALTSQNTKQLEKLEKFFGYKQFLDKLTPDDVLQEQRKLKEQRRKARRNSVNKDDRKKTQGKEELNWQAYNLNLSQGVLDLLEDSDDENEMHFKTPNQLQEFFENLEERNLFIIKHNQDIEQSIELLKHNFADKQRDLLEKEKVLRKGKQELDKAIQHRAKNIKQLHVKDDKFTAKTLQTLEDAIDVIFEKCKFLKEGKSEQQLNGIDILGLMEKKLEVQLKELAQFTSQKVFEQYRVCLNKRREELNEQKKKQAEEEQKIKLEIMKKRLMAERRFGRPIMTKSMLKKEDKEVVDLGEEDQDEIDRRLYYTKRFF